MGKLPAFNETATCPKCGEADVSTIYHLPWQDGRWAIDCLMDEQRRGDCPHGEHLYRRCRRCGWFWWEAPLDTEASA